ncbi:CIA30 family protein [Planctomicrobium sp.]|nr:CIA30 family protein [Planctomicrobium sp.]MDB4733661.1 CIA30 family protein [Planctomicrobium sp.]
MATLKLVIVAFAFSVTVFPASAEDRFLFNFEEPNAIRPWQTVNDGVMGGRSIGRVRINDEKNLEFYGTLSLANNGGFSSIRAKQNQLALKPGGTILLNVRGDGRKYNFNLYADHNLRGYSYRQSFKTEKDVWTDVRLPVNKFVATWRGRSYPNQKLDPSKANGLGILLGDKKTGEFKLEIASIKIVN